MSKATDWDYGFDGIKPQFWFYLNDIKRRNVL
jgi:hypothetical protein